MRDRSVFVDEQLLDEIERKLFFFFLFSCLKRCGGGKKFNPSRS